MKKLFLSLSLLAACVGVNALDLPALPAQEGMVKGYVHDGEKGIADVIVTDGFNFTRTDANGAYYLAPSPEAYVVYITVPNGYEVAEYSCGVSRFWATIERDNDDFQADFKLNKIDDANKPFSFICTADPQPHASTDDFNKMRTAYQEMAALAKDIKKEEGILPPILQCGDITFNIGYSWYLRMMNEMNYDIPTFNVPGNHDRTREYLFDYMKGIEEYRATFGPIYYSFNRGGVHFLMLDNVKIEVEGEYTRGLTKVEEAWALKDLEMTDPNASIVLVGHIPYTANKTGLTNFKNLLAKCAEFPNVLILTGHTHNAHTNYTKYADNVLERTQSTLCGAFWNGPVAKDGVPIGYYVYKCENGQFSWYFKPTGKDAYKNMFRLYEPEEFTDNYDFVKPEDDKVLKCNVYDWDPEWTVTWRLDGVEMGDLPRYDTEQDPMAYYNYKNRPDLNLNTYHIFHADVPNTGSKVEVTATDRFGRSLTKTVTVSCIADGIETIASECCGVATTEVYNLNGVKVLETEGYPCTDTLPLEKGIYVLKLRNTDGTISAEKAAL